MSGGAHNEWTGLQGRIGGWALKSFGRRLLERFVWDDSRTAMLTAVKQALPEGGRVLDVGAGSGYYSIPIALLDERITVTSLDGSAEMLAHLEADAKRRGILGRINIIKSDAAESGLDADSIDLACTGYVLHELSDPDLAIAEMLRVLCPGGGVVLIDFIKREGGAGHNHHGAHGPYTLEGIKGALESAGFLDISVRPMRRLYVATARKP